MSVGAVAFHDLDEEKFPFTVIIAEPDGETVLWSAVVDDAGAMRIPGFGRPVRVAMLFADGTCESTGLEEDQIRRLAEKVSADG